MILINNKVWEPLVHKKQKQFLRSVESAILNVSASNWENKKDIDSGLDMPTLRQRSDIKEVGEKEGWISIFLIN